jgi:hypothetical protein
MFCPWGKYFFTVDKTFLLCVVVCERLFKLSVVFIVVFVV